MLTVFNQNWLNDLLNDREITLYQFAKQIKKPLPTVERWISGSKPSPDMIALIINEFDLEPKYFFVKNKLLANNII